VKRSRRGEFSVDTLSKDTVVEREYVMFGPSNLLLVMFEEEPVQLYMTGEERKERERLDFTFSIPRENRLKLSLPGREVPDDWYLTERSGGHDTLSLWIKDSLIYKIDSLEVELSYLYTDSLGRIEPRADTTLLVFTEKKPEKPRQRYREGEEPAVPPAPGLKLLDVTVSAGSPHDLNRPLVLTFGKPVVVADVERLVLLEKVDTTWQPARYQARQDSLKIRRFEVSYKWKPGTDYRLTADSMAIHDIYGLYTPALDVKFTTKKLDAYAKVIANVTGVTSPVILQLCQGDKEVKVVDERWTDANGKVIFDYLKEGKYLLRVVIDRNGNKRWDTGDFLQRLQPEEIKYLPQELNLKQNFDIEQDVEVDKEYPREDPARKKKEDNKK
jgi:hypothetical protein